MPREISQRQHVSQERSIEKLERAIKGYRRDMKTLTALVAAYPEETQALLTGKKHRNQRHQK